MLDFSNVQLGDVVVHKVGNKAREENIIFSKKPLGLESDIIRTLLLKYFLSPFKDSVLYNFSGTDNEIYTICSEIFDFEDLPFLHPDLYEDSVKIAKRLHDCSHHPKIKSGELYVVFFEDCVLEDELVDAVGIFKSEMKDTYLKVGKEAEQDFTVNYETGININKLDKGCLVFNTDKEQGFVVALIDANSNAQEAVFWKEGFLDVVPRKDINYYTKSYLELCKEFANLDEPSQSSATKQKVIAYFNENKVFSDEEFQQEVLVSDKKINDFLALKKQRETEKQIEIPQTFSVSPFALKQARKDFKQDLKLDNNFSVKILNPAANFKRGFDELLGQKYYTFYFDEEK